MMEAVKIFTLFSTLLCILGLAVCVPICRPTCTLEVVEPDGNKKNHTLDIGGSIMENNTVDGCFIARCNETGLKSERVQCSQQLCNDGTAPVLIPGNCCPTCDGEIGPDICLFTEWSDWGPCSTTCGSGSRARRRHVRGIANDVKNIACNGELIQYRDCKQSECPVNCVWSKQREGECPQNCGSGKEIKEFYVISQWPMYGGQPCPPDVVRNQTSTHQCC